MAVEAPSVVKILSDLGYEVWEIENDADMRSALIEAINTLTLTNASDGRIPVLQQAVKNIQKSKFKRKTVGVDKLMNRKVSSSQKVSPQKLLPAASEEGGEKDQTIITSNLAKRLNNITASLKNLATTLRQNLIVDKKSAQEDRRNEDEDKKANREENLEKKKKKSGGTNKITEALKKPFTGFFGTMKKFLGNILAGGAILQALNWLKDPSNQAKIDTFKNFLTNNAPLILGGVLAIALLASPIGGLLLTLTNVIVSGIAVIGSLLITLGSPLVWPVLATIAPAVIGAGLFFAPALDRSQSTLDRENDKILKEKFSGDTSAMKKSLVEESDKSGVKGSDMFNPLGALMPWSGSRITESGQLLTRRQRSIRRQWIRLDLSEKGHTPVWKDGWSDSLEGIIVPFKGNEVQIPESEYQQFLKSGTSPTATAQLAEQIRKRENSLDLSQKGMITSLKKNISQLETVTKQPKITVIPVPVEQGGGQGGSGVGSGNEGVFFSSQRNRIGNQPLLGVVN